MNDKRDWTETNDKLILELMDALDEQHEMIKFLLGQMPNLACRDEIDAAIERIALKIKRTKESRIGSILVRQTPKVVKEN